MGYSGNLAENPLDKNNQIGYYYVLITNFIKKIPHMIESKRSPRMMESRQKHARIQRKTIDTLECARLIGEIDLIKKRIRALNRLRTEKLREANSLRAQATRLAQREFNNQRIAFLLDALGVAISGGSLASVRRAIGNILSAIRGVVGITSSSQRIERMLRGAETLMRQFDDLGGQLDHLTDGLARLERERRKVC